ncbi:MAG: prolyl oligopeptidase family serine peptidase [Acidimicrobiales bacterium]
MSSSFPRRTAVTRRFTLGAPRTLSVSPCGERVLFLRSAAGDDPVHALHVLEVADGQERTLIDPRTFDGDEADLPAAERARRERARETGGGIVGYATDAGAERAVAVVNGRVVVVEVADATLHPLDTVPGAFDPRLDPTGTRVAYVADGTVRVVGLQETDRELIAEDGVSWGAAEFIAAEEFSRTRGLWWSPNGTALVAERVDESPVHSWHIASPVEPWSEPAVVRYPAAGTPNADCSLSVLGLEGSRTEIEWDRDALPYLLTVAWPSTAPLTISVLSRDQRTSVVLTVDPATGATTEVARRTDPEWVEPVGGTPAWRDGRLVTVWDDREADARRVFVDGVPLTPPDMQVRSVVDVGDAGVVVSASWPDPSTVQVCRVGWDGAVERLSPGAGVHGAAVGGDTVVITSSGPDHDGSVTWVLRDDASTPIASHAEVPDVAVNARFLELGERRLRAALLLPDDGLDTPLPVLLDPYGGPHAQRVLQSRAALASSQWLADQGFAVLVIDGRGTPGRGPTWEREVRGDLAAPVLEDQVDGLLAAAAIEPRLDLTRVGIRGWSFGGYLAALAVLARPDVFHAAVAGAPVTDWRLYDTGYTERYLGLPDEEPQTYERSDLTPLAPGLRRPLMLIHGLADDNVVVAHTLKLSQALLEAGRPHTVLPLSGVTHMTPQESVAENLLLLQVAFLQEALARVEPLG